MTTIAACFIGVLAIGFAALLIGTSIRHERREAKRIEAVYGFKRRKLRERLNA